MPGVAARTWGPYGSSATSTAAEKHGLCGGKAGNSQVKEDSAAILHEQRPLWTLSEATRARSHFTLASGIQRRTPDRSTPATIAGVKCMALYTNTRKNITTRQQHEDRSAVAADALAIQFILSL